MLVVSVWRVIEGEQGTLRLEEVVRRGFGTERATWAELLALRLRSVRIYVVYFPSRFDLDLDGSIQAALRIFGTESGPDISVNFWDPTDPAFSHALDLFDLQHSPALVVATGLKPDASGAVDPDSMYMIAFTDQAVLGDRQRLADAVNTAVQVLGRGNRAEIAGFLRERSIASVLSAIGRISSALVALKPRLGLPGGVSIALGG
jgi:hypothetical protein